MKSIINDQAVTKIFTEMQLSDAYTAHCIQAFQHEDVDSIEEAIEIVDEVYKGAAKQREFTRLAIADAKQENYVKIMMDKAKDYITLDTIRRSERSVFEEHADSGKDIDFEELTEDVLQMKLKTIYDLEHNFPQEELDRVEAVVREGSQQYVMAGGVVMVLVVNSEYKYS